VGQKTVKFSDLSGQLILADEPVRIVVCEHPELGDTPVEIEALPDEAGAIEEAGLEAAVVDLYFPGEDQPRRVTIDVDAFDKLATDKPMSVLLAAARPARRAARSTAASAAREGRVNYATLEHAGKPHKGKTTEEEKRLVREHLDEINERLRTQSLRTISLTDPEHIERYGLDQLLFSAVTDLADDQVTGGAHDQAAGAAGDRVTDRAGDRVTDRAGDRAAGAASDLVTDAPDDLATDGADDWAADAAGDRAAGAAYDRVTDAA
jgi:hypothetical protein